MNAAWTHSTIGFAGLGHYYPPAVIRLDEIRTPSGGTLSPEALARLGARTVHRSAPEETVADMAVHAGGHALEDAGLHPRDIDVLILSNATERWFLPDLAPQVAHQLGADRALAFDVSAASAGFVHATQTAACYLSSGVGRRALVVCSEQFSRLTRPGSPDHLIAGDAAGAAVLTAGWPAGTGLQDSFLVSDGSKASITACIRPEPWIHNQPDLFDVAVDSQLRAIEELLERNQLKLDDFDWLVPHPGTHYVHTSLRDRLGIGDRLVTNFETCGNTISAPIPSTLSENYHAGRISRGQRILAPTVGAGWYRGGLVFTL